MIVGQQVSGTWPATDVPVGSTADVGRVVRLAASAASRQGFSVNGAGRVEQVATALATHLLTLRGPGLDTGRVLVRLAERDRRPGVELVVSTSSAGAGLEADLRGAALDADVVEVSTSSGTGTVALAQLWAVPADGPVDPFVVGSRSDTIEGESVSGDAWAVEQHGERVIVLVADGLGHGPRAAAASAAAVAAFRAHHREPVEHVAARLHDALRHTRGAAVALTEVDRGSGVLRFCGVGNIAARLLVDDGSHELLSRYGIVGYQTPRLHTVTRPWADDAMLVLHSDGLSSRWDAAAYPHLRLQHPQLVASVLMRDATRAHDDAVVVALRGAHPGPRRSVTG